MNILTTDSFFAQGHSHKVCEDYAMHGDNFIIVCDGCSSSEDTDIGARLIAKAIANNLKNIEGSKDRADYIEAARSSIHTARAAADTLSLVPNSLDATILAAIADGEYVHIIIIGDGYLAYKETSFGETNTWLYEIDFVSGAPEYLNYILDYKRHEFYRSQFADDINFAHKYLPRTKKIMTEALDDFSFNKDDIIKYIAIPQNQLHWIGLFSDGVDTFRGVEKWEVLNNMTAFKTVKGECLRRRMKRYIKDLEKQGTVHDDDVSGAVMVFEGDDNAGGH